VEPYTFTLTRPKGEYQGPDEFQPFAKKLFKLGSKLIRDLDAQQDIEFAIKNGRIYLLQSRPITTLSPYDPTTGKWNDSLSGDYLWSRNNFGEGRPDVMTPYTWSLTNYFWQDLSLIPGYLYAGNIEGRFYANISTMVSMTLLFGKKLDAALEEVSGALGRAPEGIEIPVIPFPRSTFFAVLPKILSLASKQSNGRKKIPTYMKDNPTWCQAMAEKLKNTTSYEGLYAFWFEDLEPYIKESMMVFFAGSDPYEQAMKLHRELVGLVGEGDANALFLNFSDTSDYIASLGPLVGISKLARGEISRQEYLDRYGHRGPHEAEYSIPRPIEDPAWLDRQLEEYRRSPVDVEALLAKQQSSFDNAWERLERQHPGKAKKIRKRLVKVPDAARLRENVRSESMRMAGIQRGFAVRAGEVTGLGQDIFFLGIDEILDLLSGEDKASQFIPARKETYQHYRELPPYPMIIRGRFDPETWAADPRRRSDVFDASAAYDSPASSTLRGFAGASGRVEAPVRVLDSPEQSGDLQEGEILVAVSTNVGWTPLFLRAAAVITDVGAPLSHAAIVARELGIPAVVGCGDATMRLRTGDLVRVDGGLGSVEILKAKP
jgi:pyruvate,water dikinase